METIFFILKQELEVINDSGYQGDEGRRRHLGDYLPRRPPLPALTTPSIIPVTPVAPVLPFTSVKLLNKSLSRISTLSPGYY